MPTVSTLVDTYAFVRDGKLIVRTMDSNGVCREYQDVKLERVATCGGSLKLDTESLRFLPLPKE